MRMLPFTMLIMINRGFRGSNTVKIINSNKCKKISLVNKKVSLELRTRVRNTKWGHFYMRLNKKVAFT